MNPFPDTNQDLISSRQHPLVQLARSLHGAKGRRQLGLFLIEGKNALAAALDVDFPIRAVLADETESELSERALDKGISVRRGTDAILEYAGEAQSSLKILALGEIPAPSAQALPDFLLVLNGISDPGNVGTIWRAADAAGARGIWSQSGADPWSPKVVRSAAGSTFHLPPLSTPETSAQSLISRLKADEIPIIVAEAHQGDNCFDFLWPRRAALVVGHETRGISPELSAVADFRISIPIFGRAESLNAAMAATVLLFAWAQHRSK